MISLLYFPSGSEGVSEYGFRIPEGLHRCTTKTETFFLKQNIPEYHTKLYGKCGDANQEQECMRNYHLYKLNALNAMLVVADAQCKNCYVEPYKDGPQEGGSKSI